MSSPRNDVNMQAIETHGSPSRSSLYFIQNMTRVDDMFPTIVLKEKCLNGRISGESWMSTEMKKKSLGESRQQKRNVWIAFEENCYFE